MVIFIKQRNSCYFLHGKCTSAIKKYTYKILVQYIIHLLLNK